MPSEVRGRVIMGRLTSINVRKVLWVADELGLDYRREDWGMPLRDPKVPAFLKLNPNGLVPVMVEGEFVLWESHAIMRYLAEGSGLVPEDRRQRALMEQWLAWQQTELSASWLYAFLAYGRPTPGYDDTARIAESINRWSKVTGILEARLADGRSFVNGDGFSLADIALGLAVHRWMRTPFAKPVLPSVDAYYARLRARPASAPYLGDKTP